MFLRGPSRRALVGALTALVACLLAAGWTAGAGGQSLQDRRDALRGVARAAGARAARLAIGVAAAERRLAAVEADVAARERELAATRAQQAAARRRLVELERRLAEDDQVLARQIRASYEDARPDAITVILEARGFADLLERLSFLKRVRQQDVQVIHAVKRMRRSVVAAAVRLGALELREQRIAAALGRRRDEVAAIDAGLAAQHQGALAARARALSDLRAVDRQLRRAQVHAASSASAGAPPPAPAGHGAFVFPLPKSAASPPSSWSLDDGVDIAAPGHTPLYAVGSGTIVLHGIGGFGSWAPVLHLDDGRYVYYGHAGPGNSVAVGTHVSAGAVIGEVGAGIVGISTGPHLEIGFASSGGSPIGPSSAPEMHQLLLGSY